MTFGQNGRIKYVKTKMAEKIAYLTKSIFLRL